MNVVSVICWGVFGSILSEAVKQRQKWEALPEKRFRAQFKSLKFWATVIFLTICGGVASYFLYEDAAGKISCYSCFGAGAGGQALIRNLAASATTRKRRGFGFGRAEAIDQNRVTWRDILS
jgi:hypothetical protein